MDNTDEVISFLARENPDIVCLQEATRLIDPNTSKQYHSANDIDAAFKKSHPYSFFAPSFVADKVFKNGQLYKDYNGKIEQGNHLLSKFPITAAASKFYYNDYAHWIDISDFREKDWARNLLTAHVETPQNAVRLFNVHGCVNKTRLGDDRTLHQSEFILNEVRHEKAPLIIAGDFNLVPESESIRMIDQHFRNLAKENGITRTRSIGSGKGDLAVDYIFVNDKICVRDFKSSIRKFLTTCRLFWTLIFARSNHENIQQTYPR
jgi:endonuclease/exonuclease/phosphatase family metal-dependent hydrolase